MPNVVFDTAKELLKQMQVIQKCNDSELDVEAKRAEAMSKAAIPIAAMVKSEADIYIATGTLPEHNLIFSGGEKIITSAGIANRPKKKGLLIEELTRL